MERKVIPLHLFRAMSKTRLSAAEEALAGPASGTAPTSYMAEVGDAHRLPALVGRTNGDAWFYVPEVVHLDPDRPMTLRADCRWDASYNPTESSEQVDGYIWVGIEEVSRGSVTSPAQATVLNPVLQDYDGYYPMPAGIRGYTQGTRDRIFSLSVEIPAGARKGERNPILLKVAFEFEDANLNGHLMCLSMSLEGEPFVRRLA